ncbi:MAG: hypothetical protein PUA62_09905, partial [Lachnospiraceae bacterium]|nr:hypothetical protein [Lachnospiraceae bacterium]
LLHRKVLRTSYAIKKTLRVRMRTRAQSICCKSNRARRESLASKTLSCMQMSISGNHGYRPIFSMVAYDNVQKNNCR